MSSGDAFIAGNTIIGTQPGYSQGSSSSGNVFIGRNAGNVSNTGEDSVNVGEPAGKEMKTVRPGIYECGCDEKYDCKIPELTREEKKVILEEDAIKYDVKEKPNLDKLREEIEKRKKDVDQNYSEAGP